MMPVSWADRAWEDYQYWASADRTILLKINTLLEDIPRNATTYTIFNPFALSLSKGERIKNLH